MSDRVVPHNEAAEAALISSCLVSPNALDHALATVAPDDLYTPANRRIYAAMARLHARGEPVDPITVADEVQTGDGRPGIGIDLSADYLRLADWRCNDPALRAKVLGVDKPRPVPDGQLDIFAADVASGDETTVG